MPVARAVELAVQILTGLQAVHARGIVHGDLKPANVIVESLPGTDGQLHDFAKILNLGIGIGIDIGIGIGIGVGVGVGVGVGKLEAASVATASPLGAVPGTPGYMAPEQYGLAHETDPRADLYAVAAILYQLLSGRLPFEGLGAETLAERVRSQPAPRLATLAPHVSALLADVVDRGLARDRDARWPNAEAFARALRTAVASARPTPLAMTLPAPLSTDTEPSPRLPLSRSLTALKTLRVPRRVRIALVLAVAGVFGSGITLAIVLLLGRRPLPEVPSPPATTAAAPERVEEAPQRVEEEPALAPLRPAVTGPTQAPPPPSPTRTHVESIRQVGTLDPRSLDVLADRALPEIERRCAIGRATSVEVHLHVHPPGQVRLARPAPDNPGDPTVAHCVAARLAAAVPPGWDPGTGARGIIVVRVTVGASKRAGLQPRR